MIFSFFVPSESAGVLKGGSTPTSKYPPRVYRSFMVVHTGSVGRRLLTNFCQPCTLLKLMFLSYLDLNLYEQDWHSYGSCPYGCLSRPGKTSVSETS